MLLEQLSIANYKNIASAAMHFSPKINCLIGDNGAGKTNVLDAIYFLSFCHSSSSNQDALAIRHDEDFFVLEGSYLSPHTSHLSPLKLFCGMRKGQKKHFKRNGKEYQRLSEHIGLIPLVMVSPADTSLIEGASDERRRLMDQTIAQRDHAYIDALNRYNKALLQRNALLRDEDHEPDAQLMELLEEEMARYGETVSAKRSTFVAALEPVFQHFYQRVSDGHEDVSLSYVSHCQRGPLLDVIRRDRHKDRAVGYSLHGIHRDDLEILINGHPMRREGSQGQQKTFVIALKLAQYKILDESNETNGFHEGDESYRENGVGHPILLLDDIFDKLDAHRVEQIIHLVASQQFGQIFITDTNRDHLDQILSHGDCDYRLFHVNDGIIEQRMDTD
ncbi:MAG: DNA replication and repair protein RecF [Prevotella sp.]|nr:DNA replication and repair protein RecF [Prevotella sp.]